ncbi:TlyA family RNA methyltransferase [Rubrobacter naiadicus]|uniref:TlyA family RNA methyltransferase n=1 Tax=Rubrobacter naiadicus TaxID=1392641 RepID=UPI002360BF86|nr:TlyA family RNA methyltransferase [Rubrobacter naiadicus]
MVRLDRLLVERGLAPGGSRAREMVLSGAVRVRGEVLGKPGRRVREDEEISVEEGAGRYVSRAAAKLEAALERFGLTVEGLDCLDAGCSRGGFTEVLLRRGARRVIAVDVGHGQLHPSLARDGRVFYMEGTNVRHLSGGDLPFPPRLLVADLSFIPLEVALAGLLSSTPLIEEAVVLVKPQFEAGPEGVGRGGLVRDPEVRLRAVLGVVEAMGSLGFGARDLMRAPVAGRRAGNGEYPMHLVRGAGSALGEGRIREVVAGE